LIIADDQSWTDFSFMGHPVIHTPNLDRLASEGAVFPNGYVPTSLCRASLATILTGEYGHQHRICCNDPPEGVDRAAVHPFIKSAPAIPKLLSKVGYKSFQTGKFWEGHYANAGFTEGMTVRGRHGEDGLVIGRETLQPIADFMDRSKDKPWFIWYAPMMPHEPHNPPDRILAKYRATGRSEKQAKYWAICEWMDETVGKVMDMLRQRGLEKDTLVAFVVDNGWIQELGPKQTTAGNFAPKSKRSPNEMGVRTPMIFWQPDKIKPAIYSDLVSTIDLAPTILQAAGVSAPKVMTGLSLLDRTQGGAPLKRDALFGEIYLHTWIDLNTPALNVTHRWIREGDWKLIVNEESHKQELYYLATDPMEEKNVITGETLRVKRMRMRLDRWWQGRG
jgi:uncharacterized sulfatase